MESLFSSAIGQAGIMLDCCLHQIHQNIYTTSVHIKTLRRLLSPLLIVFFPKLLKWGRGGIVPLKGTNKKIRWIHVPTHKPWKCIPFHVSIKSHLRLLVESCRFWPSFSWILIIYLLNCIISVTLSQPHAFLKYRWQQYMNTIVQGTKTR